MQLVIAVDRQIIWLIYCSILVIINFIVKSLLDLLGCMIAATVFCQKQPTSKHYARFKERIHNTHRRRIKTEVKAKVVAVGWVTYWNAVLTI